MNGCDEWNLGRALRFRNFGTMERIVRVTKLKEPPSDRAYWSEQPVEKRLEAVEFLRQQYMGPTYAEQRLQRVCRVAQKA
jgi:hypothetical protein